MSYIAADFGAGSGRIIVGSLSNGKLTLDEIHRFPNRQITIQNNIFWDFPLLLQELKAGISLALQKYDDIKGIGVDTWGVDFGLLDETGRLLSNPYCYRDPRTDGILNIAENYITAEELYKRCGIQTMEINSVYQLLKMKTDGDTQLKMARHLLFMPDLFNYYLTGVLKNEYSIASTSSMLDARSRNWSEEVFNAIGIPKNLTCDIVFPGTVIGTLSDAVCKEINQEGYKRINVFAVASHDTASAASVVATSDEGTAFLSSGTWSLMGIKIKEPILTPGAMECELTNEGGLFGDYLFLKNLNGLWFLQRLLDEWENDGEAIAINHLLSQASTLTNLKTTIDLNDEKFIKADRLSDAITRDCERNKQPAPRSKAEFTICILNSLVKKYKETLDLLENLTATKIRRIQIIGGGSKNDLLNQLTSNITQLPVIAGPSEASCIGNICVQALASGEIKNANEMQTIIANSFSLKEYYPQ